MKGDGKHLTKEEVAAILNDYVACPHCGRYPKMTELAYKYNTSFSTVSRIVNGVHALSGEMEYVDTDDWDT